MSWGDGMPMVGIITSANRRQRGRNLGYRGVKPLFQPRSSREEGWGEFTGREQAERGRRGPPKQNGSAGVNSSAYSPFSSLCWAFSPSVNNKELLIPPGGTPRVQRAKHRFVSEGFLQVHLRSGLSTCYRYAHTTWRSMKWSRRVWGQNLTTSLF